MTDECLGLELADALKIFAENGLKPQIRYTFAPQKSICDARGAVGTPRVIAVRGDMLIVSFFLDSEPNEKEIS